MNYPFVDIKLLHSELPEIAPSILDPISALGKRQRAHSLQESTAGDSYSDGSLSDSSHTPERYYPVDLPLAYLAVKNLLHTKNKLAADIAPYLKSLTKSDLRRVVTSARFFEHFTEHEFELLYRDLKTIPACSMLWSESIGFNTPKLTAFFQMRAQEIAKICDNEWLDASRRSTNLYIPGTYKAFHLTKAWERQIQGHRAPTGYQKVLDFIIKNVRSENWPSLIRPFMHEILYAPPEQLAELLSQCADKKYDQLLLEILHHNTYRDTKMLKICCAISCDSSLAEQISEVFIPWLYQQPQQSILELLLADKESALADVLLSKCFKYHLEESMKKAERYKKILRSQTSWYLSDTAYLESVDFFKNMAQLLQQAIIWSANKNQHAHLADLAIHCLKNNPLLTKELPDYTEKFSVPSLLIKLFEAKVPRSIVLDLMSALLPQGSAGTAPLWYAFIASFEGEKLQQQELTKQLQLVIEKIGLPQDLSQATANELLTIFLRAFGDCSQEPSCNNRVQDLFEALVTNKAQLMLAQGLTYRSFENFLDFMAISYEKAGESHQKQLLVGMKNQHVMQHYNGVGALYLIAKAHMTAKNIASKSFMAEIVAILTETPFLTAVSVPTAADFIEAYEHYLVEQVGRDKAKQRLQEIITQLVKEVGASHPLCQHLKHQAPLMSSSLEPSEFSAMLFTSASRYSPLGPIQVIDQHRDSGKYRTVKVWSDF